MGSNEYSEYVGFATWLGGIQEIKGLWHLGPSDDVRCDNLRALAVGLQAEICGLDADLRRGLLRSQLLAWLGIGGLVAALLMVVVGVAVGVTSGWMIVVLLVKVLQNGINKDNEIRAKAIRAKQESAIRARQLLLVSELVAQVDPTSGAAVWGRVVSECGYREKRALASRG